MLPASPPDDRGGTGTGHCRPPKPHPHHRAGAALPGHPGGRVRTEAPMDSARRVGSRAAPRCAGASPMAPAPSVLSGSADRSRRNACCRSRPRTPRALWRLPRPRVCAIRARRARSASRVTDADFDRGSGDDCHRFSTAPSGRADDLATASRRRSWAACRRADATARNGTAARRRADVPQPVMAPQRVERSPAEAARPAAMRPEHRGAARREPSPVCQTAARQAVRTGSGSHRRQEARSEQAAAGRAESTRLSCSGTGGCSAAARATGGCRTCAGW
jgi:hypothetical protein